MNTPISTYSNKRVTFDILENLKVNLEIESNPYGIPLEDLFLMAARINKKRSFLFVSKVLGKHIPIQPLKGLQVGYLLAARYMEVVKGVNEGEISELVQQIKEEESVEGLQPFIQEEFNPIVIGFAETATALGHAFFESFIKADYFHTTRELVNGVEPTITFEEEHSHATSHRVYVERELLESDREIILVDDELTTGKTSLNIIRSIQEKFPRKCYTVISILDWRSAENIQLYRELEEELNITISSVSLVKGTVNVEGDVTLSEEGETQLEEMSPFPRKITTHKVLNPSIVNIGTKENQHYTRYTGRFGLSSQENHQATAWLEKVGKKLATLRTGKNSLVLGSGEFMFLPMKMAAYMGEGVYYHSSTRSPIYPVNLEHYGAQNRYAFSNPEDPSIQHYLYNIERNQYDDVFLFFEQEIDEENMKELLDELKKTGIADVKVIYFTVGEEG